MVEFPGLGFQLKLNPVLLRFTDSFALYWYGLIIAVGFLLAVLYCLRKSKDYGLNEDDVIDMLFFAAPLGIVCARLFYVLAYWEDYMDRPADIVKAWMGGMSIYGALIGSVVTCVLFCWLRHIHMGAMLDLAAFGLLIGQVVGRWGNFVNGEVYGKHSSLPWRMTIYNQNGSLRAFEVHPLFLYECLWNLAGFFLLRFLSKKRKYNGQIFTIYVIWYGAGRAVMEGMRDESFNMMMGGNMISRVVAAVSCVTALALLFYHSLVKKHEPEALFAWQTDYEQYMAFRKERKAARSGRDADKTENEEETADEEEGKDGTEESPDFFDEDDEFGDKEFSSAETEGENAGETGGSDADCDSGTEDTDPPAKDSGQ